MSETLTPNPPGIQFLRLETITMGSAWAGSATTGQPTLVWIHGLGGSSTRAFANLANHPDLARCPSLLLDLPGHGHSDAPPDWPYTIEAMSDVVMKVVAERVDGPVILFGHSMGGSVAIACAYRHPARVARLIVAEPNLDPGKGTLSTRIAHQDEGRFVRLGYPALLRATRMQADRGDAECRDWLETLHMANPVALHRCATSLLAGRRPTFRRQVEGLSIPVAAISGERSREDPSPVPSKLVGYVVPGAGHQMMSANPGGFAQALAAAIREEPGSPDVPTVSP